MFSCELTDVDADVMSEENVLGDLDPVLHGPASYPTWFLFDEPGMDDILEESADCLDYMLDKFKISPCIINDGEEVETIFIARYEFPVFGESLKFHEASLFEDGDSVGFVDFLAGIPHGNSEIMGLLGELSSAKEDLKVIEANGDVTPPIPDDFFECFDEDVEVFNFFWLVIHGEKENSEGKQLLIAESIADGLKDEPEPQNSHWWNRIDLCEGEDIKMPVPGEFLALTPRLVPHLPWGQQRTNPFIFSGNWMETVYYTSCKILEVHDLTVDTPYPTYSVQYRMYDSVIAKSADFAKYKVGDRVSIIRNSDSEMTSWTWKDLQDFEKESWLIASFDFYGKLVEATEE